MKKILYKSLEFVSLLLSPAILVIIFILCLSFINKSTVPILILCLLGATYFLVSKLTMNHLIRLNYPDRILQYLLTCCLFLMLLNLNVIPSNLVLLCQQTIVLTVIFLTITATLSVKLSAHTLYTYFFVNFLALTLGSVLFFLMLPLVISSRLILKQHTLVQILFSVSIILSISLIFVYV